MWEIPPDIFGSRKGILKNRKVFPGSEKVFFDDKSIFSKRRSIFRNRNIVFLESVSIFSGPRRHFLSANRFFPPLSERLFLANFILFGLRRGCAGLRRVAPSAIWLKDFSHNGWIKNISRHGKNVLSLQKKLPAGAILGLRQDSLGCAGVAPGCAGLRLVAPGCAKRHLA